MNEETGRDQEEARVEAFLAPLAKVAPAARSTTRTRPPLRLRRLAVIAFAVVALGAGVAVAATSSGPVATYVDTNGQTQTDPLVPAAPPASDQCQGPGCVTSPGARQAYQSGKAERRAQRAQRAIRH
jgi:hypothetical protein